MRIAPVLAVALAASALGMPESSFKDPDVGVFWHFTDTHLYPQYKKGTSATVGFCRTLVGFAGKYGHYDCDSPAILVNLAVDALMNRTVEPDFILYGGDHLAIFDTSLDKSAVVDRLENITNYLTMIKKMHPRTKIFPVLGNHDVVPQFQFPEEGPFYVYTAAAQLWQRFLSEESVKTLNHSAYYTEPIAPGLRLVALNTVILYSQNKKVSTKVEDPAGQFAWLRGVLENARKSGERVIITTHIPPGLGDLSHAKCYHDKFATRFVEALDGYNDIIVGSFYGHNHLESLRIIKDLSSESAHVGFLTSSVTPKYHINPSVTLYKYKKTYPFTILDRIPYYLDLAAIDKSKGEPRWISAGSEAQIYGIPDMSNTTIVGLVDRMSEDEELFMNFYHRIHMLQNNDKCNKKCRHKVLCVVKNPDNKLAKKCFKSSNELFSDKE